MGKLLTVIVCTEAGLEGDMIDDCEFMKIVSEWSSVFMRMVVHDFNRSTRRAGLSLAQMNALMYLYYQGPCEVMEFTNSLQLSPAGASQMVDRMAHQGLVTRSDDPSDRRVRVVHLTDEGRDLVQGNISASVIMLESLMGSLSEQEKQSVGSVLALLTQRAKEGGYRV